MKKSPKTKKIKKQPNDLSSEHETKEIGAKIESKEDVGSKDIEHFGWTSKGEKFMVPETLDTISVFLPWNLGLASSITLGILIFFTVLTFFGGLPVWVHVAIAVFWRVCYNFGLGLLLRAQSNSEVLTKLYNKYTSDPKSCCSRIFYRLASEGFHRHRKQDPSKYPAAFNTWIVFKHLVNLVLVNDFINYLLLGYKCFHLPTQIDVWVVLQYVIAVGLGVFNYWAKVDAHRCVGEYCWYWGDFFFRKDQNLTFDGIFELFPHPMYTVGYALHYGYSMLCRSYTLLFVSITAHLMQMAFLVFVEEPHIQKTYGSGAPDMDQEKFQTLYDPRSKKPDSVFLFNFSFLRLSDFAVFVFVIYGFVTCFTVEDPTMCLIQVVVWRLFHWLGLGSILYLQSRYQFWTHHFAARGFTLYEAFANWKGIYNLSVTMNLTVFLGYAIREFDATLSDLLTPSFWARVVLGLVLILLSLWSVYSTYKTVGDFGWFYGDFFISKDSYQQNLCYTGIYRFLNNPDALTGYAGWYGLALISQSWNIFALALVSQVLNALFLNIVEVPHMKKLYSDKVREQPPISRVLKKVVPVDLPKVKMIIPDTLKQKEGEIRQELRKVRVKAMADMLSLYRQLRQAEKKERKRSKSSAGYEFETSIEAPERIYVGDSLSIKFSTDPNHSEVDWLGIYSPDTPSAPGASDGKWRYVGNGGSAEGVVVFPPTLLPQSEGFYELRYHLNNEYNCVATAAFTIMRREDDNSPKIENKYHKTK